MKKSKLIILSTNAIIVAFMVFSLTNMNHKIRFVKSDNPETNYQLVFNSSNTPSELNSNTATSLTNVIPSRHVAWNYSYAKSADNAHVIFQAHATNYGQMINQTPIQGITSLSIVVEAGQMVSLYGANSLTSTYDLVYTFSEGDPDYPGAINYPFLKIESANVTTAATITSMTINYSCLVPEEVVTSNLAAFKTVGNFESGNSWTMSGTTTYVSLSTDNAYFNNQGLLINGWSGNETAEIDLSMSYHLGFLAPGDYTFIIGSNITHATVDIKVNEMLITTITNEYEQGGGQELSNGTIYNGKTLDWSWMRSTIPFTLETTEDVTISINVETADFYEEGVKTTWGAFDGIEIIQGSTYLEPVCLRIPAASISEGDTLTTATVNATVYNHSYPSVTSSNILFTTTSSNISISNNIITGLTVGTATVTATINYGDSLTAITTFDVTVVGLSGDFLTTISKINSAGNFEASDWSVVTAGWTHLASTTTSYLSNEQKYHGDYAVRPNGNSGLASGSYSLYYLSGLSFKANKTYTISYYYYNSGNIAFAVGVSNATPTTSTTVINSTTLSGWVGSWQKVSFTYSPGISDLTNRYFFIRMLGSGGTGYGFIDYLQIEVN